MPLNVPNVLTWFRILMIPVVVGVFYLPGGWLSPHERNLIACVVFAAAAITDVLDGYLARRLNQMSAFGAFLDPVADKLMVAAALIVLVELARVNAVIAVIIIGREIAISALREWMAQDRRGEERGGQPSRQDQDRSRRWSRSRCCSTTTGIGCSTRSSWAPG